MRKFMLATLLFTLAGPVRADLAAGDKTVAIFVGAGGSGSQYDYQPGNKEKVTGGGGAYGAQFLYYLKGSPAVALGVDLNNSLNGNVQDGDLLFGIDTTARMKTFVGLLVARLSYPRGAVRPYIFAGVGAHNTWQQLSGQPQPGVTWPGGGAESRILVDQKKTSAALAGGFGFDIFPTESIFLGVELRNTWLAGMDNDQTTAIQNAGFRLDTKEGLSEGNLFFRAGIKLGGR